MNAPAVGFDDFASDDPLVEVVWAGPQHDGMDHPDDSLNVVVGVEHDGQVDVPDGVEDRFPFVFRNNWPERPLGSLHASVRVEEDDEGVPLLAALAEVAKMPAVQDVKAAGGNDRVHVFLSTNSMENSPSL